MNDPNHLALCPSLVLTLLRTFRSLDLHGVQYSLTIFRFDDFSPEEAKSLQGMLIKRVQVINSVQDILILSVNLLGLLGAPERLW